MDDRRQHQRAWERIDATLRLKGAAAGAPSRDIPATALNLSEGGVYVAIPDGAVGGANAAYDNLLLFRSRLEIRLALPPRGETLTVECKTAWIGQQPDPETGLRGIALQFVSLDEPARRAIAGFVAQHAPGGKSA